jgi:hypothetical protein
MPGNGPAGRRPWLAGTLCWVERDPMENLDLTALLRQARAQAGAR